MSIFETLFGTHAEPATTKDKVADLETKLAAIQTALLDPDKLEALREHAERNRPPVLSSNKTIARAQCFEKYRRLRALKLQLERAEDLHRQIKKEQAKHDQPRPKTMMQEPWTDARRDLADALVHLIATTRQKIVQVEAWPDVDPRLIDQLDAQDERHRKLWEPQRDAEFEAAMRRSDERLKDEIKTEMEFGDKRRTPAERACMKRFAWVEFPVDWEKHRNESLSQLPRQAGSRVEDSYRF